MEKRRNFTEEFKREAEELASGEGVSAAQVARDLGLHPNQLYRLRRELHRDGERAFGDKGRARDEEMVRLKRELGRVKRERDSLR